MFHLHYPKRGDTLSVFEALMIALTLGDLLVTLIVVIDIVRNKKK